MYRVLILIVHLLASVGDAEVDILVASQGADEAETAFAQAPDDTFRTLTPEADQPHVLRLGLVIWPCHVKWEQKQ